MNRKQKIIVSVVGITIVLLALLGLTYAYFLTRINGNTNTKSISVSTANLALVYGDDDGSIIGEGETITPGTTFDAKTFTVTNQGNAKTDYVVVIEDVSVTYAETIEVDGVTQTAGSKTTFQSNDFVYTLTCTSGCNGVDKETTFPINGGILVGNSIDVGETQTYAFTLTYKETGLDQTEDMNKTLNAKLNIKDISTINPYSNNTSSLAYNIINNAITGANGTTLMSTPLTTPAVSTSMLFNKVGEEDTSESSIFIDPPLQDAYWTYGTGYTINEITGKFTLTGVSTCKYNDGTCHETLVGKYIVGTIASSNVSSSNTPVQTTNLQHIYKVTTAPASSTSTIYMKAKKINNTHYSVESTLSVTPDDYGTSYYFRGAVEDNYVTFADMCWRIVRIEGDGSTKLILEDQDQPCSPSINGNWAIPTTTGGSTYIGNFGYTEYASNTLTASDGTQNSDTRYIMNYLHGETDSNNSMATAFKNFQSTFTEIELSKLKAGNWCLGDAAYSRTGSSNSDYTYTLINSTQMMDNKIKRTVFYYDSNVRLSGANKDGFQPTLKCNGTIMNDWDDAETNPTPMYVGTITADEVAYAGGKVSTKNPDFYLINEEFKKERSGANKGDHFWSLSPNSSAYTDDAAFLVNSYGYLTSDYMDYEEDPVFRPAVTLLSSTQITGGNGTVSNPYTIAD